MKVEIESAMVRASGESEILMGLDSRDSKSVSLFEGAELRMIEVRNSSIEGIQSAFLIEDSSVMISSSNFSHLGNFSQGNAIRVINSNLTVNNNNVFRNNSCQVGGAISIQCPNFENQRCMSEISNNTFRWNKAFKQGGAISYLHYRPNISNNVMMNNSAPYGNDVASFGVRLG
jgi:hypothetical protein